MFECLVIIHFICLSDAQGISFRPSTLRGTAEVRLEEAELSITLTSDSPRRLDPARMDRACVGESCVAYFRHCETQPTRISCGYALFGREHVPAFELSAPNAASYARAERHIRVAAGPGIWIPLWALDRTREWAWPYCNGPGRPPPVCPTN
ncbi:MAG TPA: hypothetical protein VGO55_05960 [Allosphingosinicella sp.]|jgi:hypothetical protein|nr:hypothetical protein [Allosphingosinicella sp.]